MADMTLPTTWSLPWIEDSPSFGAFKDELKNSKYGKNLVTGSGPGTGGIYDGNW